MGSESSVTHWRLGVIAMLWLQLTQTNGWLKSLRADNPPPDVAALSAAKAFYEGIRIETLPNGLTVVLKSIPGSPVVSTKVAYKVGSSDEELSATGLSHYLEHLMFKGTEKIMPGDIDRLTLRNGGQNNAYTSEDMTMYHFDFAADRWERALEVEADRMRNLRIDSKHEFEQEKGAVIEELARDEDEPWDLEHKTIVGLLFGKSSPYGHPVIGEREHVRSATAQIIKSHYDKWYHPNNAILVVCGGFDPELAITKIRELFGPIPKATLPARKQPTPVDRSAPIFHRFESKFEVARLLMAYNTVDANHPDADVLEVISGILAGGKTGRLYRRLVEKEQIASAVSCGDTAGRYPGAFQVQVEMLVGKDREQADRIVLEELGKLRTELAQPAEMARVKQTLLSSFVFGHESVHDLADVIASGLVHHDLDYLKAMLPRLMAVTAADVQRVAQKYLDPSKRVAVWSVPKAAKAGLGALRYSNRGLAAAARFRSEPVSTGSTSIAGLIPERRKKAGRGSSLQRPTPSAAVSAPGFTLESAKRVVLDNGLTVLLFENRRLPIVTVEAFARNAQLLEPAEKAGVARLVGSLLDEGTATRTGPQIADAIESLGASMNLASSGGELSVLAAQRKPAMAIFFDCLMHANFADEEFTRLQRQQLSEIEEAERQPAARATHAFEQLAYGPHPFARPSLGYKATVEKLTAKDCRNFFASIFCPNNMIVAIVGDIDAARELEEIRRLTADWRPGKPPTALAPLPTRPAEFTTKIISMPEAAQLQFLMGHVGIKRKDPDFYKLLVMDYVLGTGPGFTDRLSARLRDREGLAYTVSANICGTASEQPGLFTCFIGTDPKNFAKVKDTFLEELRRIRSQPPTAQEVDDVKRYLLGSLAFEFTTNAKIAGKLVGVERVGIGFDFLKNYRESVEKVTPEDVLAVAQKHLDPDHMVLVAAGALDANGKPAKVK